MAAATPTNYQVFSYPLTVNQIPYASWMRINKYTYQQGLEKVGKNQKDALSIVGGNNFISNSANAIGDVAHRIYNSSGGQALADVLDALKNNVADQSNGLNDRDDFGNTPLPGSVDEETSANIDRARRRRRELKTYANSISSHVAMALPNEFQYEYGANWNNTFKLGTLALLADNMTTAASLAVGGAFAGGAFATLLQRAGISDAASNTAQAAGAGAAFALDPFGVSSQLNPTNIVGLAGLAPNENAIQFFKNMDFRSFTLNFELAARNSKEADQIEYLIYYFKRGMHPASLQKGGTGGLLGFPDVFTLEPQFNEVTKSGTVESKPHPMMPKTKLCGLTNLKINTTPFNTITTVFDGSFPLITMQLTFTELTALTSEDFQTGGGGY